MSSHNSTQDQMTLRFISTGAIKCLALPYLGLMQVVFLSQFSKHAHNNIAISVAFLSVLLVIVSFIVIRPLNYMIVASKLEMPHLLVEEHGMIEVAITVHFVMIMINATIMALFWIIEPSQQGIEPRVFFLFFGAEICWAIKSSILSTYDKRISITRELIRLSQEDHVSD